jgi:hypothetical protein
MTPRKFFCILARMNQPPDSRRSLSRRAIIKTLAAGAAASAVPALRAASADSQHVDVHDPQAVALGYVEHASDVDPKKFPRYVEGSNCENCLQLQGKPGNNYRPCNLFSGKLVSVSGWCSGWTAEM